MKRLFYKIILSALFLVGTLCISQCSEDNVKPENQLPGDDNVVISPPRIPDPAPEPGVSPDPGNQVQPTTPDPLPAPAPNPEPSPNPSPEPEPQPEPFSLTDYYDGLIVGRGFELDLTNNSKIQKLHFHTATRNNYSFTNPVLSIQDDGIIKKIASATVQGTTKVGVFSNDNNIPPNTWKSFTTTVIYDKKTLWHLKGEAKTNSAIGEFDLSQLDLPEDRSGLQYFVLIESMQWQTLNPEPKPKTGPAQGINQLDAVVQLLDKDNNLVWALGQNQLADDDLLTYKTGCHFKSKTESNAISCSVTPRLIIINGVWHSEAIRWKSFEPNGVTASNPYLTTSGHLSLNNMGEQGGIGGIFPVFSKIGFINTAADIQTLDKLSFSADIGPMENSGATVTLTGGMIGTNASGGQSTIAPNQLVGRVFYCFPGWCRTPSQKFNDSQLTRTANGLPVFSVTVDDFVGYHFNEELER